MSVPARAVSRPGSTARIARALQRVVEVRGIADRRPRARNREHHVRRIGLPGCADPGVTARWRAPMAADCRLQRPQGPQARDRLIQAFENAAWRDAAQGSNQHRAVVPTRIDDERRLVRRARALSGEVHSRGGIAQREQDCGERARKRRGSDRAGRANPPSPGRATGNSPAPSRRPAVACGRRAGRRQMAVRAASAGSARPGRARRSARIRAGSPRGRARARCAASSPRTAPAPDGCSAPNASPAARPSNAPRARPSEFDRATGIRASCWRVPRHQPRT